MKVVKSKYSNSALQPFVIGIVLFGFVFKCLVAFLVRGHFLYPEFIESLLLDYVVGGLLLISFSALMIHIYHYYITLKITTDHITVRRLFEKAYVIDRKNIIYCEKEKEDYFTRYSTSGRYFILKDKSNIEIRIKISEYYIRNYDEIQKALLN